MTAPIAAIRAIAVPIIHFQSILCEFGTVFGVVEVIGAGIEEGTAGINPNFSPASAKK
jgi:hypothetical protein